MDGCNRPSCSFYRSRDHEATEGLSQRGSRPMLRRSQWSYLWPSLSWNKTGWQGRSRRADVGVISHPGNVSWKSQTTGDRWHRWYNQEWPKCRDIRGQPESARTACVAENNEWRLGRSTNQDGVSLERLFVNHLFYAFLLSALYVLSNGRLGVFLTKCFFITFFFPVAWK